MMQSPHRELDPDSYEDVQDSLRGIDSYEEDSAYFPPEESKPPHY